MSWLITPQLKSADGLQIATPFGGGYVAGFMSLTADGNPTHALIIAPAATGASGTGYTLTTNHAWATDATAPDGVNYSSTFLGGSLTGSITGTTMNVTAVSSGKIRPGNTITGTGVTFGTTVVDQQPGGTPNGVGDYTVSKSQTVASRALTAGLSDFDGIANGTVYKDIDNTVGSGSTLFPAANFCEALTVGGFTDWYLPARWEIDIAYFHLKPDTTANNTGSGANPYSVPKRTSSYTALIPAQTDISDFRGGSEAFAIANHWVSSERNEDASFAHSLIMTTGLLGSGGIKTITDRRTRAFRRVAL